ncbi:MAG: hypothetical protein GY758_12440 [Fuerstiella sp.]|nr:hypothetical protein [Fuerstiella sp.]MCP4510906.1 hypothetical protein [Fuerstiella sp.]
MDGANRNLLIVPDVVLRELLDEPRLREDELREPFEKPFDMELRELPPLLNLN